MSIPDLSGSLALLGGVSGVGLLVYFILMVYYTRRKELATQEMLKRQHAQEVGLARIEGILIGRRHK